MNYTNKLTSGCPRFLTKQFDANDRDVTEKALARFMRDNELTPKQFANR